MATRRVDVLNSEEATWTRRGATGRSCTRRGFIMTEERNFLQWEQTFTGTTSPGVWCSPHHWWFSRCDGTGCWVIWPTLPFPWKAKPDDFLMTLLTWVNLWFYGMIHCCTLYQEILSFLALYLAVNHTYLLFNLLPPLVFNLGLLLQWSCSWFYPSKVS